MTASGHCESFIAYTLIDNTYLYLNCTLPGNHDDDHHAVFYWSQEIEDDEDAR